MMNALKNSILSDLESRYILKPLAVPEDLKEIKRFLGVFQMNLYNWEMDKVRKINIMRCSVKVPGLEIFAIEIYPETDYDIPLLAIDFSCMKNKFFVYMNFIPLFADAAYREKYILPMKTIFDRYEIVPKKKAKEWMNPYLTDYTVYAMPDNALLGKACDCARDYLAGYLDVLDRAEKITDADYQQKVASASLHYCDQLSEKDGSRKMLGRFTGMDRANRIFREVIR